MARLHEWVRDGWVPVLITVVAVTEASSREYGAPTAVLSVLLPMAWITVRRRHEPELVAIGVTAFVGVLFLAVLDSPADQAPLTGFLALLTTLFALGVHGGGRLFLPATLGVGLALATLQATAAAAGQDPGDLVPSTLFMGGAFGLGRLVHRSRNDALRAGSRAEAAERERDRHAAMAVERERARIARELHDVIAHSLSVMVIQASVEARLHSDQSGTTADTLRSIERTGRDAMSELRRLLGLLREEGQGPADAPLPTVAAAVELVAPLERAGHRVDTAWHGDLETLPPGVGLAAYRVLQECLTNTARHAPGAPVQVTVERGADGVTVTVDNDPARTAVVPLDSSGVGLAGMRERVRLYGGQLRAVPREDGGFRVMARIPVPTDHGSRT
jgi:signal transduction histidine kinase